MKTEVSARVLAVVVTHNGREWLGECLKSLRAQSLPMEVVVVDSGSDSSVEEIVAQILPDADFVRIDNNVGFGAAANHALEVSGKAPDADYFLFIHDDTALFPDAVEHLATHSVQTASGVVGGKGLNWHHPETLVEVGMQADQFGFPYAGLEEGEIDQGQHDSPKEVLYVSNACMLVSRLLVERCGLFDADYFAFGEDLDLCTRARLSGFKVSVQPAARFRHAVALAHGNRPVRGIESIRFFTRRNRLRTIMKNVAFYRLFIVLTLYGGVMFAEIGLLIFFRRFRELSAYPRALYSFLKSVPQVLARRRAVQKRRSVPDRRVRRFMTRDTHRARVFLERRARDWEHGTLAFGARTLKRLSPSALKETLGIGIRKPQTIVALVLALVLVFAMRGVLFGDAVAAGSLWPFPESTRRFLTDYFVAWRDIRLGTESAAPPAFVILWFTGVLSLGNALGAQKILLVALVLIGLVGVNRFMARRTQSISARLAATAIYSLGPATHLIVSTGDLAALALFAGLPFLLEIALRMLGPVPGEEGDRPATPLGGQSIGRDVARLGLIGALVVALAPSAFLALAMLWVILGLNHLTRAWDRRESMRRIGLLLASLPVTLVFLIPWSFEALRPRASILGPLFAGRDGSFSPLWSKLSFEHMFLMDIDGRLASAVVLAAAAGALILAGPSARKESRLLGTAWIAFALIGGLAAKALIPPPVASPAIWIVVPLLILALMSGHFVSALRDELPRYALGWRHIATPAAALLMMAGFFGSWIPGLAGWTRPRATFAAGTGEGAASISSYLTATAREAGDFRVLWLGDQWVDPIRSGSRRMDDVSYLLTGPRGLSMLDAFEPSPSEGERRLDEAVTALVGRRLHLAGHLLAPASVRFIIIDPRDELLSVALGRQRDIALEQQQGSIAIYRNLQWLPRAGLAPDGLTKPVAVSEGDDPALLLVNWSGGKAIPARSQTSFRTEVAGPHNDQVLLAENFNNAWRARIGDVALDHGKAFGWANRFDLPKQAKGQLRIWFARRYIRIGWLFIQAFVLLVGFASSRTGSTEIKGAVS